MVKQSLVLLPKTAFFTAKFLPWNEAISLSFLKKFISSGTVMSGNNNAENTVDSSSGSSSPSISTFYDSVWSSES